MLYTPHTKQLEVHHSPARYKVLNWGRRTGKSTLAVNYAVWEGLKKYEAMVRAGQTIIQPLNYFIVAPTYRQAKSIYWNDIIKARVPREIVADYNEAELTLTIPHHNTDAGEPTLTSQAEGLPAITIQLKGSDNEDSLRGVRLAGVVLDEYAFMKPVVWDKIIRPALSDERGWALFISTPNGFNHFYELCELAQGFEKDKKGNWVKRGPRKNWYYSKATIFDNPHINRDEIEEIKEDEYSKDPDGTTWHQEYLAEFKQMAGLVYKDFNREHNLISADKIPSEGTRMIGIDFGYEAPFAAVFVIIDYDNNWYVYDLIYERRLVTDQAIARLRDKMTGQFFTAIVGDPGGPGKQEIANFRAQHFPIRPAFKGSGTQGGSIRAGVRLIAERLRLHEQPDGKLRPKLFIRDDLKPIILEFETYHYPEDALGTAIQKDIPVKENDHALDALRYLFLARIEHRKPIQRPERHYDAVTGRLLS